MLSELNHRFSGRTLDIMRAIQSCNPQASSFLDPQKLLPIVNAYDLSKDMLAEECPMAKCILISKSISSVYEVFVELAPLRNAFPTLLKLLQIILTVAVSSVSCERTFSSLKRIKTWLRTTMTEQRLTDLAIITIERDSYQQSKCYRNLLLLTITDESFYLDMSHYKRLLIIILMILIDSHTHHE